MFKKKKIKIFVFSFFIFGLIFSATVILFYLRLQSQKKETFSQTNDFESRDISIKNAIEGLPEDFPIYRNSKLVTYALSDDGDGKSYIWETDDEVGIVYEYLKSKLRIEGWEISNDSSTGNSSVLSFEKNKIIVFLGVFKGSGGERIVSVTIRTD